MSIKYPLSVIDGRQVELEDAFSFILNYYNPNKYKDQPTYILDSTCSIMKMWKDEDKTKFKVTTNDIRKDIKANYHHCCSELHKHINQKFHIIIYDPPYIDLKGRNSSEEQETIYGYEMMEKISDLKELTMMSSLSFYGLIQEDGILIVKITNFHFPHNNNARIRGSYDLVNWFSNYFYLWDEIIYRFYKPIPNLGNYNKKAAKTHTYFLIFKQKKL